MTIRIVLVDDHAVVREGFRALFRGEDDLEVVGEAADGEAAIRAAVGLHPDVVVMDVRMPGMNGIEATRRIAAEAPGVKVLGLSMHLDRQFVAAMLRAGACGYVLKDSPASELMEAVRTVAAGETHVTATLSEPLLDDLIRDAARDGAPRLSPREEEVTRRLAAGRSVREIAEELGLSIYTVHTHRKRIMAKLGIESVAELTKYAIKEGLTEL